MKYKCIAKCRFEDVVIMNPGDIVNIDGDKFYNITTGTDYKDIGNKDWIKGCLEVITDDIYPPVDKFKTIIDGMYELYKRKNHDYGNSFEQSLNEEGLAAARIRMGDKWNRFKTLSRQKAQVTNESIRDTLIDMANYSIMTIMWLDNTNL